MLNRRFLCGASLAIAMAIIGCSSVEEREQSSASRAARDRGYPYISDQSHAEKARIALSPDTPEDERFEAVWALAISGYTEKSALALAVVACDKTISHTTRGYAAMGLRNFTSSIPQKLKSEIQEMLRGVIARENADTPDGVIRTLIAWADAPFVYKTLGPEAAGHPMEIEILAGLPGKNGVDRLWQIYESCPKRHWSYFKRSQIGRAMVKKQDTRGIDILMELLPAAKAPSGQYRHNVFKFLAIHIGQDFGYNALNYDPSLNQAVAGMLSWWDENRHRFALDGRSNKQ